MVDVINMQKSTQRSSSQFFDSSYDSPLKSSNNVFLRMQLDEQKRKDRKNQMSEKNIQPKRVGDGEVFGRLVEDYNRRSQKAAKIEIFAQEKAEAEAKQFTSPKTVTRSESNSLFERLYSEKLRVKTTTDEVKPQVKITKDMQSSMVNRLYASRTDHIKKRDMAKEIKEQQEYEKYQKIRDSKHPKKETNDNPFDRLASRTSYKAERITKRLSDMNLSSGKELKRDNIKLRKLNRPSTAFTESFN